MRILIKYQITTSESYTTIVLCQKLYVFPSISFLIKTLKSLFLTFPSLDCFQIHATDASMMEAHRKSNRSASIGSQFPASTFPETFKDFFSMINEDEDQVELVSNVLEDKVTKRSKGKSEHKLIPFNLSRSFPDTTFVDAIVLQAPNTAPAHRSSRQRGSLSAQTHFA